MLYELHSSFTQPRGNITSDVRQAHLVIFAHLCCHETERFSILTLRRTSDCLKACVGVDLGTLACKTMQKREKNILYALRIYNAV